MRQTILRIIKIYQKYLSPDHGFIFANSNSTIRCRFYPSCSQYSYESIEKFGTMKGVAKSFIRILRCNPFSKGGVDPV
ncbi:MAG TPA: membrane protein insertion efficiency factor YidD [Candidatus Paceibacterota bacterium]